MLDFGEKIRLEMTEFFLLTPTFLSLFLKAKSEIEILIL